MTIYSNTRTACKQLGVHPNTLRRWEGEGKIKAIRTPGNRRLYDLSTLLSDRKKIIYARVSSNGQQQDLEQQITYLRTRYPGHELIQDIGSGLNFKRKGLTALLELMLSGNVEEVVIAHKDRLCRFGFDLISNIAARSNTRIVVLDDVKQSPHEELVQDLLSIIHVFSCRLYGLRRYSDKIKKDPNLCGTTEQPSEVS